MYITTKQICNVVTFQVVMSINFQELEPLLTRTSQKLIFSVFLHTFTAILASVTQTSRLLLKLIDYS